MAVAATARRKPKIVDIDPATAPAGLPLFQKIAECLVREIERGALCAGDELPSSRALAAMLEVHRNTVVAAYDELVAQGYAETRRARGTFVSSSIPERHSHERPPVESRPHSASRRDARSSSLSNRRRPPLELPEAPAWHGYQAPQRGQFGLLGGIPDLRPFAREEWARAYRKAVQIPKLAGSGFEYGSERGHPKLLEALRRYGSEMRGIQSEPDEVIVTRGSQQALHLAACALCEPGASILVEAFGYRPAWEGFRLAGARPEPMPVDDEGISVEAVAERVKKGGVRALYLTPHHQYPTTKTLSPARRMELLSLAERHRFVVLEDDYDHEFHFEGRPVLPMKARDEAALVLHVGTFSKVLAPGLRLGYAFGRPEIIARMAAYRAYLDRQGDHTTELTLAEFLECGDFFAHVRRMHRIYGERREFFLERLRAQFGGCFEFEVPRGGLCVWARTPGRDARLWSAAAAEKGLTVHAAVRFHFEGENAPYFRLGFAPHTPRELARALDLLEVTMPKDSASSRRKGSPRRRV